MKTMKSILTGLRELHAEGSEERKATDALIALLEEPSMTVVLRDSEESNKPEKHIRVSSFEVMHWNEEICIYNLDKDDHDAIELVGSSFGYGGVLYDFCTCYSGLIDQSK